jgi:hypothetical protein
VRISSFLFTVLYELRNCDIDIVLPVCQFQTVPIRVAFILGQVTTTTSISAVKQTYVCKLFFAIRLAPQTIAIIHSNHRSERKQGVKTIFSFKPDEHAFPDPTRQS